MSEVAMVNKMGEQPKTKDKFKVKWETMSQATKESTLALYNIIKPLLQKGPQVMEGSTLKMMGMHAFMRKNIQKQAPCEVLPLVKALMMEAAFTDSYHPQILTNPTISALHMKLQNIITMQQRQRRFALLMARALAQPKMWTYWDGLKVPEPLSGDEMDMDQDAETEQFKTQERLEAINCDRQTLMKLQDMIVGMLMSQNMPHKESPVNIKVAEAINALMKISHLMQLDLNLCAQGLHDMLANCDHQALSLSASHIHLWVLSKIPHVDGKRDLNMPLENMLMRKCTHQSEDDMEDSNVPPIKSKSKSKSKSRSRANKGKGEASFSKVQNDTEESESNINLPPPPMKLIVKPKVTRTYRRKGKEKPAANNSELPDSELDESGQELPEEPTDESSDGSSNKQHI
ncbi:hypothetical protein EDB19DRAFT_1833113 [Suillus lakei]|nr:hypothetical protein EDB19DRAFT_1833113 [Suillus lakei]